ncbi:NADH-dependent flavin oxidoreductase [Streptococcus ovuberis]|uniref:NADH-dependent flavin oxidoreductase n=1 Tax=Streptococcus ovuberis TaxID=1936207 RepID=A0A7X6S1J5_9STRE|nr:NADH-dependent flavin oxidoreductase [Streptococcus ovuberis]NKZ20420.1 NADH-dependent flavin oxidoreductase [Streptococcus ovuberis]
MFDKIQDQVPIGQGLKTRNRVVLAPMTLSACEPGGYVSQADIDFYERRSLSAGLLITGSAYVHPQGQAFADSFSAAEDDKIEGLSRLAQAMKKNGSLAILQLYHGGRMVAPHLIEGQPVAPSAVKAEHGYVAEPRALKHQEVEAVLEAFLAATRRAIAAGFDGVELHGANTYLIQQFFSPHSNHRRDKWGGSLNNRMRFAKTLLKKTKQLAKQAGRPFLVGYRFSPEEIEEPGITLADSLQLLEQLITLEVDYLHISASAAFRPSLRQKEAGPPILLDIVKKIRDRVPLIAVGAIQTRQDAQAVLDAGVPLVSLGRALLLDPDWTAKVTSEEATDLITVYRDDLQEHLKLPTSFVEDLRDYLENTYEDHHI